MVKTVGKKTLKDKITNVYIGWDSRESIAADVCKYSIQQHAANYLNVKFLKQEELRQSDLYWRDVDNLSTTEFTFTRFLVPYLNNYEGYAIFMDCDFLLLDDIANVLDEIDPKKAVTVVQHDYTPAEGVKMDGKIQRPYPRKNWSSMIVWNCAHPANKKVDLDFVNTATGQELHRFTWLKDKDIGNLAPEWNWLVGWYRETRDGFPKALHYTEGGPWFEQYKNCEYADVWNQYHDNFNANKARTNGFDIDDLEVPSHIRKIIRDFLNNRKDPHGVWHNTTTAHVIKSMANGRPIPCIGVVDGDPDPSLTPEVKKVDVILDAFLTGADGVVTMSKNTPDFDKNIPVAIRGIAKRKIIKRCEEEERNYFYIDTGYFGNDKHKTYHRITKNSLQYVSKLDANCPSDRLNKTGVSLTRFTPGKNILLCPPSQKAMNFWGLDLEEWLESTINYIKKYSDRPIVVRTKSARSDRVNVDTMQMALSRDVHCMVTYNSIAAVESLIYGKSVFTMGPNAAQPLALKDLSKIEAPYIPSLDEVHNLLCNLAYQQFTVQEMKDGTAWDMLNGDK